MKTRINNITRILLGSFMVILGLNNFLVFIEIPSPPGNGGELMQIYISSGFLKLVGALELVAGITLLLKKFVPIAITIIIAIMFNATVFHILHDPIGTGPAAFCLLLGMVQIFTSWERISPILKTK